MSAKQTKKQHVLARFLRCESGATAIEYGLIAAGISVAIAATVLALGPEIRDNLYQDVVDAFGE
ncbi:MAG: Flp family type IVb pilin [Pseudomonadota bacterium]